MISIIILTKNSAKSLRACLESTTSFAEVIVLDSGSTDATKEIALTFPHVKWYAHRFLGFGPMRRKAEEYAANDWIFALDSDEILSPQMISELQQIQLNPRLVYTVSRHNFFNGKWIKWCGWYPDRQLRLYNRTKTTYNDALVHERVMTHNMQIKHLKSSIYHYSYEQIDDFLSKMQTYSSLFAKQRSGKKKTSFMQALFHGNYAFFKSFILQRGFLGGKEGLIISLYNGHTTFYKYLKLIEENRKVSRG